jgi:penicillin-binding protein 1A
MADFKSLTHKNFWLAKWRVLKVRLYPYFRPMIVRYRAYEARHPRKGKVFLWTGLAGVVGFGGLLFFVALVYLGAFGPLPTYAGLNDLNQNIASEVYSGDGELLGKYYIENRRPAGLEDISPNIIDALISTEDARFFEHGGIDLRAWVRVFLRTVLLQDESGGGGSTLSQQLAKNLYPRKRYSILTIPVAKVKEVFIANRLEHVYDKNELLALYLNTVPFGDNVFGIKVAAQHFFGTTPNDIKVEEAAVLIGMLKANSAYNPARHPERALSRRNTVLGQMVKYGRLDSLAFDSLSQLPIKLKYSTEGHNEGLATYFRGNLRLELEEKLKNYTKPDGRPYNLYTDGLKIYTTINAKMQQYAEEAVAEQMKVVQKSFDEHFKNYKGAIPWGSDDLLQKTKRASERYQRLKERGFSEAEIDSNFATPVPMTIFSWETESQDKDTLMSPLDSIKHYLTTLNTGFLAVEPQTGKVLAWVGGINFKYFKYDHVKSIRQVGSTFKPIVYAAALQSGVPPCERLANERVTYEEYNDWAPRNADGNYGGTYSMQGGLKHSINAAAVGLIMRVGVDSVRRLAKNMGISTRIPREPGIALGSVDASVYDMVRVFSTFPNRGVVTEPYYLTRIETAAGDTLVQFKTPDPNKFRRVMHEQHADMMTHLLQGVVDDGTGARLRYQCGFDYPAAGKTGTTNNNSDGWFTGYTPDIVAGAWVGAEQPVVRFRSTRLGQGAATALPICGKFFRKVYNTQSFRKYRNAAFYPLDSLALAEFDCPDYIPADSVLIDSFLRLMQLPGDSNSNARKRALIRMIEGAFKNKAQGNGDSTQSREIPPIIGRESERIRKQNERLEKKRERQKNRQDILEQIFGKKKKGGGEG